MINYDAQYGCTADGLPDPRLPDFIRVDGRDLPVYMWDDSHDESEWVSVGADGHLYHRVGGHSRRLLGAGR